MKVKKPWKRTASVYLAAFLALCECFFSECHFQESIVHAEDLVSASDTSSSDYTDPADEEFMEAEGIGEVSYIMPSMEEMEAWISEQYGNRQENPFIGSTGPASDLELFFDLSGETEEEAGEFRQEEAGEPEAPFPSAQSGETQEDVLSPEGAQDGAPVPEGAPDDGLSAEGAQDDILSSDGASDGVLSSDGASDDVLSSEGASDDVLSSEGASDDVLSSGEMQDEILNHDIGDFQSMFPQEPEAPSQDTLPSESTVIVPQDSPLSLVMADEEALFSSGSEPYSAPREKVFSDPAEGSLFTSSPDVDVFLSDASVFETSSVSEPEAETAVQDPSPFIGSEETEAFVPDESLSFLSDHPGENIFVEEDSPSDSEENRQEFLSMIVVGDLPSGQDLSSTDSYTLDAADGDDITIPLNYLIQCIKDSASDEHPLTIVIPSGSYLLTGTISLYSNLTLLAEGAVITKTSPVKQIIMRLGVNDELTEGGYEGFHNVHIEGGTWDLNYSSIPDSSKQQQGGFVGFRLGHVTNLTLRNVHFRNNLKSHFLELAGAKDVVVEGCSFSGYWEGYATGGQECIQLDACLDSIFPHYLPYDGTTCENVVIENNTFDHVFAGAGAHSMIYELPYHNIRIEKNTFRDIRKRAVWCLNFTDSTVQDNIMEDIGIGVEIRSVHPSNVHVLSGQSPCPPYVLNTSTVIQNNQITLGEPRTMVNYDGKVYSLSPCGIMVKGHIYSTATEAHEPGVFPVANVTIHSNTINGPANGILFMRAEQCFCTNNILNLSSSRESGVSGITVSSSSGLTVDGNTIHGAGTHGIELKTSSAGNQIQNNQVDQSGKSGISLASSCNDNILLGNTVKANAEHGILVTRASHVTIQDNEAVKNGQHGIDLEFAKDCTISGGKTVDNHSKGIYLKNAGSNIISRVSVKSNEAGGIGLYSSSSHNSLENNIVTGNTLDGILISNSDSNTLSTNSVTKNGKNGIYMIQSKDLALLSNKANSNPASGIYALRSSLAAFSKNVAYYNQTYGIRGSSSVFSGVFSNKTYSNGKASQIIMNSCSGMTTMNKPVPFRITSKTTIFAGKAVGAARIFYYSKASGINTRLMGGKVTGNTYRIKGKTVKKGTQLILLAKDARGNEVKVLYSVS